MAERNDKTLKNIYNIAKRIGCCIIEKQKQKKEAGKQCDLKKDSNNNLRASTILRSLIMGDNLKFVKEIKND